MNSETYGEFITLARVVKTQGRRGEVAVEVHSDVPGRFTAGMKLFALGSSPDPRRELEVEDLWPHKELLVLKFRGVDSISQAEALVGCELQLPRSERAPLEQGWSYISDLVGCSLFDHGSPIGRIEDVQFGAGEAPLVGHYEEKAVLKLGRDLAPCSVRFGKAVEKDHGRFLPVARDRNIERYARCQRNAAKLGHG